MLVGKKTHTTTDLSIAALFISRKRNENPSDSGKGPRREEVSVPMKIIYFLKQWIFNDQERVFSKHFNILLCTFTIFILLKYS